MRFMRPAALMLAALLLGTCCGCAEQSAPPEESSAVTERIPETVTAFAFTKEGVTKAADRFLPDYSQLAVTAPEGAVIRYTLDGSVPTAESEEYKEPIVLKQYVGDFPNCAVLRAKVFFPDGSESQTATETFWTSYDIHSRFHNLIVSVVGDPKEITEKPDGIFYGKNVKLRGRESERAVSVEFVDQNGGLLLSQDAGMRIFGAASREAALKSMKLFARKSYDPEHGKFAYDGFGTAGADGEVIAKYDKLVIRNGGNDFQFAFIRDELFQTLAKDAGHSEYEAVQPVVVYLNGSYYGVHWLHESVCNDLLEDKYGSVDGRGKYLVLEGKETEKTVPEDDAEEAAAAAEFNETYAALSALDLTDDANYAQVCDFLDVQQYLEYFAYNIYINNNDWPQNNQKCYRYLAGEGEAYSEAEGDRRDGKWRFWYHDMDYSSSLYGQDETQPEYDNLAEILKPGSKRYAPLFAALMQRGECREAFRAEITRLMEGALSAEHIRETLDAMNSARFTEMRRYFDNLEERKKEDKDIWIWYEEYQNRTNNIRKFADSRAEYMQKFLNASLPSLTAVPEDTSDTVPAETTGAETTAAAS
ncbi:MAG: CotH kinase family protein [Oscillospiraceae bacterium]|nr:CotH kinase family protein [Oscillospiraceae bacterium]